MYYIVLILIIVLIIVSILSITPRLLKYYNKNILEFFGFNKPVYIFWTGGYDSTFRLCQLLIDHKKRVQPIYISDLIDNEPGKKSKRHSVKNEYEAMDKVVKTLHEKFPFTQKTLLPIIDIDDVHIDTEIERGMKLLKKQKKVRRSVCQYGALAQVAKNINKTINTYIEICVEGEPKTSIMYRTIHKKVKCNSKNECYLKKELYNPYEPLSIFRFLRYPTLHLNKKDMYKISIKNKYDNILRLTWSCWHPNKGKPCGRCHMCKERVI